MNPYATRYRPPFACSAFSYPLVQQFPLRVTCRGPDELRRWQTIGLTVFRVKDTSRLGSAYSPTVTMSVCPECQAGHPTACLFWPKPDSAFGLLTMTTFISSSHMLTVLLNLAPHPPWRWQKTALPRGRTAVHGTGYIVPVASHRVVTNPACTGRLRLTEQSVSLLGEPR